MNAPIEINATLTAAQSIADAEGKNVRDTLLAALAKHEGDSDLGLMCDALLAADSCDYDCAAHGRSEDISRLQNFAGVLRQGAENFAEAWEDDAETYWQQREERGL